jgi:hypothetical protein
MKAPSITSPKKQIPSSIWIFTSLLSRRYRLFEADRLFGWDLGVFDRLDELLDNVLVEGDVLGEARASIEFKIDSELTARIFQS